MTTPGSLSHPASWRRALANPDVSRAVRATIAFMVPLLLAVTGWLPVNATFATLTAQNLAMVDVRGDYRLRFLLLLAMAAVFVSTVTLGTLVAPHLGLALLASLLVTVAGAAWRHLSSDYGPSLAISSTFVFLLALATPPGHPAVAEHALGTAVGAAWGILVQTAAWPFRAQHPLRRAVSDTWLAVAELIDALATPLDPADLPAHHERVGAKESALRAELDAASAALRGASSRGVTPALETLNRSAAHLALQVSALNTAIEALPRDAAAPAWPAMLEPILTSLSNLARSIAVATVSRQPSHLLTSEVRVRRATALLGVVRTRFAATVAPASAATQVTEIFGRIEADLPSLHPALEATTARANERGAASLELLDLRAIALRPLASALNLTFRVDPALVRFAFRAGILTALGITAYRLLHLPHGYWIPFTSVVVLQPDYGSTRRRASQRVLGTLVGSLAATLLIWLRPPGPIVMLACAATIFIFGYWLRRNYAIAVIFITLFVVLLTEATGPVSLDLAIERLGSTAAGGLLALLAAQLFWPVWERERLPPILAAALRANRHYLVILGQRTERGGVLDETAVAAKRATERASAAVFSSLNRLNGDPKNQREGLEFAATIANGNQRITRALNGIAAQLSPTPVWPEPRVHAVLARAADALEHIASEITAPHRAPAESSRRAAELERLTLPPPPPDQPAAHSLFIQLTRLGTEVGALLLLLEATSDSPPPQPARDPGLNPARR